MAGQKLNIQIEYCQHWGHALRAAWMAGEALSRAGEHIETFTLIPGEHGKFRIFINGDLVAAHEHRPDAHLFPDLQDMMKAIHERLDSEVKSR